MSLYRLHVLVCDAAQVPLLYMVFPPIWSILGESLRCPGAFSLFFGVEEVMKVVADRSWCFWDDFGGVLLNFGAHSMTRTSPTIYLTSCTRKNSVLLVVVLSGF